MLRYRAESAEQWERIIREEFSRCELPGIEQEFTGDIDVLTLPGGIWFGELTSGLFNVAHDPRGRFRPTRDELMIVMHHKGQAGRLWHRGRRLPVVPGGAVSVDLYEPYHFGYSSSMDQSVLKIPRHLVSAACFEHAGLARNMAATSSARLMAATLEELRAVGTALESENASGDRADTTTLRHEFEMLSMSLRDLISYVFGRDQRIDLRHQPRAQVQLVKDFLEANYWNPSIRSDDIAASLQVSTRQLSKIFKSENTTPVALLRDLRLDKAAALMASPNSELNLSDISHRVGFGDISTFGRAFKSRFGCTPAEYRSRSAEG